MRKSFLYPIFNFLLLYQFYISAIYAFLVLVTFSIFTLSNYLNYSVFAFFATLSAYTLQRYFKLKKGKLPDYLAQYTSVKIYLIFVASSTILTFTMLFFLNKKDVLYLLLPVVISSLYLFIHPSKKALTGLRYIPYLKTFLVALSWVILPMIFTRAAYYENPQRFIVYYSILFVQVWQSCIIFDWRDRLIDKGEVKTIASETSPLAFKIIWLILSLVILIACTITGQRLSYALPLIGIGLIMQWIALQNDPDPLTFTYLGDGSLIFIALGNFYLFAMD